LEILATRLIPFDLMAAPEAHTTAQ